MTHKKLLTKRLAISILNITHDTVVVDVDSWVVQDDITVVGLEMDSQCLISRGLLVEAGGFNITAEVTRAAELNKDSALLVSKITGAWSIAGDAPVTTHSEQIIFPLDVRVDIDNGEALNLIMSASSLMTSLDTLNIATTANILYYNR